MARWGILKNASWLKNRLIVCSFLGGIEEEMRKRSFDRMIPVIVIVSAISLVIIGIVVIGVV